MPTPTAGIHIVDSHTGGEPTRLVVDGGPDLGSGSLAQRLIRLRETADDLRQTVVNEPRGWDAIVGALLCESTDPHCAAGVIFFNNTGYLGMCGHGAIGVAVSLHYLGRVPLGRVKLETPVGPIEVTLQSANEVTIENVPSYRWRSDVTVNVEELGPVTGDVAWGGNWFFLVQDSPVEVVRTNIAALTDAAWRVRRALAAEGVTGRGGIEIDHIEFFAPATTGVANSRNFVLCPGGAYDRSPCGTGTSAKIACLAADGKLGPGETWVQESIIGSRFAASYHLVDWTDPASVINVPTTLDEQGVPVVIPRITGQAFISGEGFLVQQPEDPFRCGVRC
ncbi:proline racemase family protein [Roseimaritima sediminicola]|uniref:proline racemase family protein n=1 Tax=Roseimaritima sediminicola TaxID=2662066 RepID=UPI001F2084EC|nr:proline racemase family protein [Roseimaritima sediminicola]